jgi:WD40 repeat protein
MFTKLPLAYHTNSPYCSSAVNHLAILQEYNYHLGAVNTVTFIDENRRFVSSSDDKSLRMWEFGIPVQIKYVADPSMHSMPAVTPNPAGTAIICQSLDNQVRAGAGCGVWCQVPGAVPGKSWSRVWCVVVGFDALVTVPGEGNGYASFGGGGGGAVLAPTGNYWRCWTARDEAVLDCRIISRSHAQQTADSYLLSDLEFTMFTGLA